jgi:diguanylate cyclase (GGDEF)-like protein
MTRSVDGEGSLSGFGAPATAPAGRARRRPVDPSGAVVAAALDAVTLGSAVALVICAAAQDGGRAALNGIVIGLLTLAAVVATQRADAKRSGLAVPLIIGEVGIMVLALASLPLAMGLALDRPVTTGVVVGLAAAVVAAVSARLALLARRVDQLRRAQVSRVAQLARIALHDPLTGLPNRALVEDRLAMAMTRQRRTGTSLAVLFCDLDRFKHVNDTLGHESGDAVLQAVADRLQRAVRSSDTVSRLQGDEFVILCPDLSGDDELRELVGRILRLLAEPMPVGGRQLLLTASVGVAMASAAGPIPTLGELLREADVAMYRAKAHGRNRWERFAPSMAADGDTPAGSDTGDTSDTASPSAATDAADPTLPPPEPARQPARWHDPRGKSALMNRVLKGSHARSDDALFAPPADSGQFAAPTSVE